MSGGQDAFGQQCAHRGGQVQQPQDVGHVGAAFAHPLGGFLLSQAVVLHQGFVSFCFFNGIEILALQVFNHGQLHGLAVVGFDDEHRHLAEAGHPSGSPAAFAGDDLIITRGQFAHCQRLQNAVPADGIRQILQGCFVKLFAGLFAVGLHLGDGQHSNAAAFGGGGGGEGGSVAQEGAQAFAQAFLHGPCHRNAPFHAVK